MEPVTANPLVEGSIRRPRRHTRALPAARPGEKCPYS